MKYSFSGVSTDNDTEKFLDQFELMYDDSDEIIYQSKEVFRHDVDDDMDFKYRYCVEIVDLEAYDEDDMRYAVNLLLVPEYDCLHQSVKDELYDALDVETTADLAREGYGIKFGAEIIDNSDSRQYDENQNVQDKLAAIANTYRATDSLRGFYLDRCVNLIGSTGWDYLRWLLYGEDYVQAAMDRYTSSKDDED